jgi:hypothetical protein
LQDSVAADGSWNKGWCLMHGCRKTPASTNAQGQFHAIFYIQSKTLSQTSHAELRASFAAWSSTLESFRAPLVFETAHAGNDSVIREAKFQASRASVTLPNTLLLMRRRAYRNSQ